MNAHILQNRIAKHLAENGNTSDKNFAVTCAMAADALIEMYPAASTVIQQSPFSKRDIMAGYYSITQSFRDNPRFCCQMAEPRC